MSSILIKNCHIVNADSSFFADILIKDEKIEVIGQELLKIDSETVVIDAENKFVFPGGIDPHVHFGLKTASGILTADNFESGTLAAIFGGTTTVIDFVTPEKDESIVSAFKKRIADAKNSYADYSFHGSITSWKNSTISEMSECMKLGLSSFKVYMAYKESIGISDLDLVKSMADASEIGALILVHAEAGDLISWQVSDFIRKNKIEPVYHPLSRDAEIEAIAIETALKAAKMTECPVYIVHVSSKAGLKKIENYEGVTPVFAETCPHYLLLDDECYKKEFNQSVKFVLSPPLRKKEDNTYLLNALKNKIFSIGTDHCSFMLKDKISAFDFSKIPNGAGGVEHRLKLLFTYGVKRGVISVNRFVELISANPAKIFGLYPKKGLIAPGSDADIVIWDSYAKDEIKSNKNKELSDISIFEGFKTEGAPDIVILRGKVVIEKNKLKRDKPEGIFLRRNKLCPTLNNH